MGIPSKELTEKYSCTDGKILLVCDQCGLLYCGEEQDGARVPYTENLIIHRCYACKVGGLE